MSFADFKLIGLHRFPTSLYMWGDNTYGQLGDNRTPSYFSWSQISSGGSHTVAIRNDGTLWGWGRNAEGQLGLADLVHRSSPTQISSASWNKISAGLSHTAAIRSDSTLWSWGSNIYGQIGSNDIVTKSVLTQLPGSFNAVAAGGYHTAAINTTGQLFTWGWGSNGQLGGSGTSALASSRSSPIQVGTANSWLNVSAGKTHTTVLATDYTLWAFGDNTYGELGDGTTINRSYPVQIGTSSWSQVSSGGTHTAAIKTDGSLYAWGLNSSGQLGLNTAYSGSYWTTIAYGDKHTLAIRNDGTLWGWGRNNSGQLGQSDTITRSSPTQIGTSSWIQVSAGLSHSIALRSDGKLFTWGDNVFGQLGNDPVQISTQWSKITISSSATHTLAIRNDGTLWAWGLGTSGQLGDNTITSKSSPVQISSLNTWIDVAAGSIHSLGITNDSTLYAWGSSSNGQLGDGTTVTKSSPVVVGYGYKKVFAGTTLSGAIDINNNLYMWGYNTNGALGDGSTLNRSNPLQIGTATWNSLSMNNHVVGIKTDGTLWAWGLATWGVLGQNDIISRSSPVQVGSGTWLIASVGGSHTTALASDYTIWSWGTDQSGQMAQNLVTDRSSPVQLGAGVAVYSWSNVNAGQSHTTAIRTDGTLWVWGGNATGQLGQNDTLSRSSPTQLGTGSWTNVWSTGSHVIALDSTNAYYAWGMNTTGQAADNTIINRSSPVQVQTTTPNLSSPVQIGNSSWSSISAGYYHNMGIGVDGILYGWGRNDQTQIGGAILGTLWSKVVVSGGHSIAIKYDGTLWAWGSNTTGQLGDGTTTTKSSPVAVTVQGSRFGKFIDVAVGQGALYTSFAVRNDGRLFAWGNNSIGQLGIFSWKQVSVGSGHSLLLRNDGQLYAWGLNNAGQLGDATTVNKSVVTLIGLTSDSWTSVSAGQSTSAAIRNNGTLYTWGLNTVGQLGLASTASRSSPTQVAGSWSQIAIQDYALATNIQGSLWSWGNNNNGQLGVSATTNRKAPQLVDGTTPTYSVAFDNEYLSVAANNAFTPGTNDFTVEAWVYQTARNAVGGAVFELRNANDANFPGLVVNATGQLAMYNSAGIYGTASSTAGSVPLNTWTHVAWVRRSNVLYYYINGISRGSTAMTNNWSTGSNTPKIGGQSWDLTFLFAGYISNLRYVNGLGVYTGNFTVPTAPLSATQGLAANIAAITTQTALLVCQSSTLIDNSGLSNTVSVGTGTPTVTQINPTTNAGTSTGKSWSVISAGGHSLGITNGSLYTWGLNTYGQLGVLDTISRSSPVAITHTDGSWITAAASMTGHSAAIDTIGVLHTWGNNSKGELGQNNEYQPLSSPTQVAGYSYTQVVAGNNYTLATATTGSINQLFGFGINDSAQLNQLTPFTWSSVQPGAGVQIASGATQGKLYVWGNNAYGTIGANDTITRSSPVQLGGFYGASNFKTVQTTPNNILALTTDGTLYLWGDNTYGQLGQGDTLTRSSPVQLGASAQWSTVVISQTGHVIGVSRNGTLFAWGNNQYQELGQSQPVVTNFSSPVIIGADADWARVAVANNLSIATKTNGVIYTWGRNDIGQAGVTTPLSYTNIGAYSAVRNDGKIVTWGINSSGQLGQNDIANRSAPTQVSSIVVASTSWVQVAGSLNNRAAIKVDGKLFMWGDNTYGQLGQLDTQLRSAPIQIGTSSWTQVYVNVDNVFAIRSDNTLWAWGNNNLGQLGDGTTVNKSFPTQIASDKLWSTVVAAPSGHVMAIRNDGTLWSWGNNQYNELGQNQYVVGTNTSSPTQVGTGSYLQVAAGSNFTMALRSDNSLWGWGRNDVGQIGLNNNSPLSWTQVTGGQSFALAIRSDGKLYSWGSNAYGQLGQNDTVSRSVPTYVGSRLTYGYSAGNFSTGYVGLPTGQSFSVFSTGYPDFTAEMWIYTTSLSAVQTLFTTADATINNFIYLISTQGKIYFAYTTGNPFNTYQFNNVPLDINRWYYIAITRTNLAPSTGYTHRLYIDGVLAGLYTYTGGGVYDNTNAFTIGGGIGTSNKFNGYISDFRLSNIARTITSKPTSLLQNDQYTILLTLQNSGFVDNSSYNNPLVVTGTLSLTDTIAPLGAAVTSGFSWTQVNATSSHVVALRNDNTIWSWGLNASGQLGFNDTINRSLPVQIGNKSWTQVTTGKDATFAVDTSNRLYVVGNNSYAQLGTNDTVSRSILTQVAGSWSSINSSSTGHTLGIRSDGTMYSWGSNQFNELGLNQKAVAPVSSPTQVGTSSWSQVSAGGNYTLAIRSDNTLWAWGRNDYGQIGNTSLLFISYTQISLSESGWIARRNDGRYDTAGSDGYGENSGGTPFYINTYLSANTNAFGNYLNSWAQLSSGANHTVAVRSDGTLWAWGRNNEGQLGQNNTIARSSAVQIGSASNWTFVTANSQSTFAIDNTGALYVIGSNAYGQLGLGNTSNISSPVQLGSTSWSTVSASGTGHVLAITSAGLLFAWGNNQWNELGLDQNNNTQTSPSTFPPSRSSPVQVGTSSWTQVSAGYSFSTAIRSDGGLFTWGINDNGQLAATTVNRSWTAARLGAALRSDGKLFTWFMGTSGSGQGDIVGRSTPTQIPGGNSWAMISTTGYYHTLAIRTDGILFGWGSQFNSGVIGDGTTIDRSSPVQIGSSSWSMVVAGGGGDNSAGITVDGRLFTWGRNTQGQLGLGTTTHRSSPMQVGTSSWLTVSTGTDTTFGITVDGTLWGWGDNTYGQLGLGDTINRSTPTSIRPGESFINVVTGNGITYFIRNDYKLFGVGQASSGTLGDGTIVSKSSPVQIGATIGTSSWTQVAISNGAAFAIMSDGKLFSWGSNFLGQLGGSSTVAIASTVVRSLPVQIGAAGSSWTSVHAMPNVSAVTAFTVANTLWGWGDNSNGAVGDSTTITRSAPVQITNPAAVIAVTPDILKSPNQVGTSSWTAIAAGGSFVAGISAFKLFTWGYGLNGELGGSSTVAVTSTRSSPVQVGPAGSSFTAVSANSFNTGAITTAGTLWVWGRGSLLAPFGVSDQTGRSFPTQITSGVAIPYNIYGLVSSPTQIGALTTWSRVLAGTSWSAGTLSDGKLFMWGGNSNYELGVGTTASRSSPVQLGTSSWSVIGGSTMPVARTSLGTLFAWGNPNTSGQLGVGDTALRSQPTQITTPSLTGLTLDTIASPTQIGSSSWTQIAAGDSFVGAINTSGQLFTWGLGTTGQLGGSATTSRSSPVQVATPVSSWAFISAQGTSNMVAITTTYTLFSWGTGTSGQVGDNTTVTKSVPTAIGALTTSFLDVVKSLSIPAAGSYIAISGGDNNVMAIRSDNTLWSWGKNDQGQLGVGATTPRSSPTQVGAGTWTSISVGNSISAGISSTGGLFTWGLGASGQQGSAATTARSNPTQVGASLWSQVAAGANSMIGTTVSNIVFVWGQNNTGQLGISDTANRSSPVQLGSNLLASMYQTVYPSPVQVATYTTASWVQVSAGDSFTSGIDNSGRLYTWGRNNVGQLGDSSTIDTMPTKSSPSQIATTASSFIFVNASSPVQVTGGGSYASIAAGGTHTIAIRTDGTLWGWGTNTYGQVGTASVLTQYQPKQVDFNNSYVAVAAGTDFSAGINYTDKTMWRWGYNASVDISSPHRSTPQQIGSVQYSVVSAAGATAFAISTTGTLYEWGRVSTDDAFYYNQDIAITPWGVGQSYINVNAGDSSVHVLRNDYSLWAYGNNNNGQLGVNDTNTRSAPVQIAPLQSWTLLGGGIGGPAVRAGALYMMGNNASGQLGLGDITNRSSPTQVPAASMNIYTQPVRVGTNRWSQVSAGATHTVGLLSDNTLYAWGYNASGQVGDSTVAVKNSPVLISSSSYSVISAGKDHSAALRIDNTIWTWGLNTSGQLGDNTNATKSALTAVVGGGSGYWTNIIAGSSYTAALGDNNTLWVWGDDNYG